MKYTDFHLQQLQHHFLCRFIRIREEWVQASKRPLLKDNLNALIQCGTLSSLTNQTKQFLQMKHQFAVACCLRRFGFGRAAREREKKHLFPASRSFVRDFESDVDVDRSLQFPFAIDLSATRDRRCYLFFTQQKQKAADTHSDTSTSISMSTR